MIKKAIIAQISIVLLISLITRDCAIAQSSGYSTSDPGAVSAFQGGITPPDGSGAMTYGLPLLTIKSKGMTLPITLNYTGDGMQPLDRPSWVGEGWNLQVGGSIMRKQHGNPDDIYMEDSDEDYKMIGYLNASDQAFNQVEFMNPLSVQAPLTQAGIIDIQPDIYQFNTGVGFSGSYSIERKSTIVPANTQNINNYDWVDLGQSIYDLSFSTLSNRMVESFALKDNMGYEYIFDEREEIVLEEFNELNNIEYTSEWKLGRINSEIGETIFNFLYNETQFTTTTSNYFASTTRSTDSRFNDGKSSVGGPSVDLKKNMIHEIIFDGGRVEFVLEPEPRLDIENAYALHKIIHFNTEGVAVATYIFNYTYKSASGPFAYEFSSRLFLESIDYHGNDDSFVETIAFEYDSQEMPWYETRAIDHWGYYNSTSNNTLLSAPGLGLALQEPPGGEANAGIPSDIMKLFNTNEAERAPSLEETRSGILTKISHHNGSTEEFEYELNTYSEVDNAGNPYSVENYEWEEIQFYHDTYANDLGNLVYENEIVVSDIVDFPQWVQIKYEAEPSPYECILDLEILDYYGFGQGRPLHWLGTPGEYNYNWVNIFVEPGETLNFYPTFGIHTPSPPYCIADPEFYNPVLKIKRQIPSSGPERFKKPAGGLRLKKHIRSDGNDSRVAQNFDYDKFDDSELSSGVMFFEPNKVNLVGDFIGSGTEIYSMHSSRSLAEQSANNGVIYTNISSYSCPVDDFNACITDEEGNDMAITEQREFRLVNYSDVDDAVSYPFVPTVKNQSRKALLDKSQTLDFQTKEVFEEVEYVYDYSFLADQSIDGKVTTTYTWENDPNDSDELRLDNYRNFSFSLVPEYTRLQSVNSTTLIDGVSKTESKSLTYEADDKFNDAITETTQVLADGSTLTSLQSYSSSFDFAGNSPSGSQALAIAKLQDQGRVRAPIESISFRIKSGVLTILSHSINFYEITSNQKVILQSVVTRLYEQNEIHPTPTLIGLNGSGEFDFTPNETDRTTSFDLHDSDYVPLGTVSPIGRESGVIRDSESNRIFARSSNGSILHSRYTSFEEKAFHGGWGVTTFDEENRVFDIEDVTNGPSYAPSGNKVFYLDGTSESQINSKPGSTTFPTGEYLLSYYRSGDGVITYAGDENDGKLIENRGEWQYVETVFRCIEPDECWVTMAGQGYIDELRIHEIQASMSSQGYYPDGKLMYEADAHSNVKKFYYDSRNRLEWVRGFADEVLEHHEYEDKDILDEESFNEHTSYGARKQGLKESDFYGSDGGSGGKVSKSTSYYDGWGRLRQMQDLNVFRHRDLISFNEFDLFGREIKTHLPYVSLLSDSEDFIDNTESDQLAFYADRSDPNENNFFPYSEVELENNPLQRPIRQSGIGEDFQMDSGHETEFEYGFNSVSDEIRKWYFDEVGTWANSNHFYSANELHKVITTYPGGNRTVSYTDYSGQEIARGTLVSFYEDNEGRNVSGSINRIAVSDKWLLTYTVYDNYGRVRYEIPAKAIEEMEKFEEDQVFTPDDDDYINPYYISHWIQDWPNNHKEFITYYGYDEKGRNKKERRPGETGLRWYLYDAKNRLILSHIPSNEDYEYTFYKYDSRDRLVLTGEIIINESVSQSDIDDNSTNIHIKRVPVGSVNSIYGYSNDSYPIISEADVLQVFYHDSYDFNIASELSFSAFEGSSDYSEITRNLSTGSLTRTLNSSESLGDMLMTVSYYDERMRPLQSYTENHKGGFDRISNIYDDKGQLSNSLQHHRLTDSTDPIDIRMEYTYTNSGDIITVKHGVNDDEPVLISSRFMDEFGKLKKLRLHKRQASNYLQSIDYRYNELGQLTHINNPSLVIDPYNDDDDDVFGQELIYHKLSPEIAYDNLDQPVCGGWPNHDTDFSGQISGMIWNVKTPEQDGATLNRHLYVYDYDDSGQLIRADYGADSPSNPGIFNINHGRYSTNYNYDFGGNITALRRRNSNYCQNQLGEVGGGPPAGLQPSEARMDDLTYTYKNNGFLLDRVDESADGDPDFSGTYSHFTEGFTQAPDEYSYDRAGRNTKDDNKGIDLFYNTIGKISRVDHSSAIRIDYLYDAAGNKLQKSTGFVDQGDDYVETDYVGNFVYENGELKMIYHSEGVIRPREDDPNNPNEFVYDYFVKDYLGNVRVVVTEEDETEEIIRFLATMEEVHALIEENNFDNVDETRDDLPQNYPVDGSAQLNLKIAELIADGEMVMGPSKVLNVRRGEKITASVEYFYEEDAPGATYDNLGFFVNEILVAFASSAAGVVPVGDGALFNIASGNTPLAGQLEQFLSTRIDTNDLSKPQAYLVYLAYDLGGQLNASNSGAIQVDEANQLRTILTSEITADKAGFMHIYVSNGSSAKGVSFNDFLITSVTGKTRQINHYYPYGLPIGGLDENEHKYLNKYTGKEHQTGEYMDRDIDQRGLEMFDFEARFWEPQLARWTSPDPAMQFSNPYLGIGNNPVMYVDPDGEFILIAAGVLVGAYIGGAMANDHMNPGKWDYQSANTWIGMGVGGAIGAFGGHALSAAKGKAIMTFGKTMSKTAGKKFFGSTVGGMTNSITNYGGADDFGWGTLGDFGAGFGGAYAGISTGSKIAGFNAGGFLNSVNNIAQDGFGTPYEFAQDWIGGGLSSMVGMSYGMPKPAAPVGQKATLKSFGKSFVKYSGQSAMWDFAYTKQEDFAKRNFGDFAMLYGVGGVMGASVDMLKFMTPNAELGQNAMRANKFFRTGMNAAISLVELRMTSQLKGKPGKPKAQPNKAGVLGEKWSFNFLNYY